MVTRQPLLTIWAQRATILHKVHTSTGYSSFHRDCPKSSRNLPKWNLSVVLNELSKAPFEPMKDGPQTSYSQNCFLASFGLWQVPQRNPCLGCKQSIQSRPMGKGFLVPFFRLHSQKTTSKRRFSKCVFDDYSCFDYHCR